MNIKNEKGITLVVLVIMVALLLIISGISITGGIRGQDTTKESVQFSELNMIQHAILERYTKAQLTKETLPGKNISLSEVQKVIDEINNISSQNIELKGKEDEYKELTKEDLEKLEINKNKGTDTYIVNYNTGEVINKTQKVTKTNKALYIYAKNSD